MDFCCPSPARLSRADSGSIQPHFFSLLNLFVSLLDVPLLANLFRNHLALVHNELFALLLDGFLLRLGVLPDAVFLLSDRVEPADERVHGPLVVRGHHRGLLPELVFLLLALVLGLRLEGQRSFQGLRHLERVELPLSPDEFLAILAVRFVRHGHAVRRPELADEPCRPPLSDVHDGVVELLGRDLHPALAEHEVRHQDPVLEGRSEAALGALGLLDLASDARDRLDLRVRILRNLQIGVEHVLDERSVLEDLVRLADELKFLHDVEVGRGLEDAARGRDPEVVDLLPTSEGHHTRIRRHHRPEHRHGTMGMFQRVLQEPHPLLAPVLQRERRHRLIPPPAHREQERVVALQQLRVPAVPLYADLHEAHLRLAGQQAAEHQETLAPELRDTGRGHVLQTYTHEGGDGHAVREDLVWVEGHRLRLRLAAARATALAADLALAALGAALGALNTFGAVGGHLRLRLAVLVLLGAAPTTGDELPRL
mmetsp:Transcript_75304/g.212108  ORF Transcript_75304/g.212108 Transcript_75304/m.212108 type:complete len:483 (-) Transcript_75304:560-2008(-)